MNNTSYLAYRRNASLVVNALSLSDAAIILGDLAQLKARTTPYGIQVMAWNTLGSKGEPEILAGLLGSGSRLRYEFLLDCPEYALSGISSNHRRNVRKSEKSGAMLSLPTDLAALNNHIELVDQNLGGKGVGGLVNSAEYFASLVQDEAGMLAQVFDDNGNLQGTTFFLVDKRDGLLPQLWNYRPG